LVRVQVLDVAALSDDLAQQWRELAGLTYEFGSPLVGPDFARLVGKHHPNTKVAIGFEGQEAIGFFAFHPSRKGYARPVGAPFCDYQAIVTAPNAGAIGAEFLQKAGITSLTVTSLMDPHNLFDHSGLQTVSGYRIDTQGQGSVFEEKLRAANPKWAKNIRRLANKMDRELGPVSLVGSDTNQSSFDALMSIKIGQYHETGVTNVLRSAWVKGLMADLFHNQSGHFGGCLISLYSGKKFVAGHFGVRLGNWFHPWIASTCPVSHPYSPGIVFLSEATRQANELGLRVIDLSAGHSHYKAQFCREPVQVLSGILGADLSKAPHQGENLRGLIERRLDLIASVELDFIGQASAFGTALAALPKRLRTRRGKTKHD
jgi:CelD/BcsL family acetyltransferase involved in cellulose biosynthesis